MLKPLVSGMPQNPRLALLCLIRRFEAGLDTSIKVQS